ncbi:MAG: YchF/TatD family DNA exonuclease, partial [Nitrospinota bacterium]
MSGEEKRSAGFSGDDGRPPLRLFDSHVHLEMGQFERDREAVVARAQAAGVEYILTVGSSLPSSRRAIEIARHHPGVFAAVGVHPHESKTMGKRTAGHLSRLAKSKKVVAVGEIGLDYYRNYSPRDLQQHRFREQLGLARTLTLPVIVHNRAAERDILSILREENAWEIRGVIHCFSGEYELAKEFLDLGFFISLAGPLTFEKSAGLRDAVKRIPLEALLLETDAPYLAPHPHRGRRNEPAYLRHTAQSLAELKGLSLEDVARVTTLNARVLLGLGPHEESGKIAYQIRDSLYLNVTNRCTNCCFFCARFFTDYVKGHNLKLEREPSAEEMLEAVGDPTRYREI